jgi:type I restriction enzyme S subunit
VFSQKITISLAANIAETAILGIEACFPDSIIGFIPDNSKCDVRFIKYKFDTVKQQYQQVSRGAAQDNLSLEKLLSFKLTIPSVQIQKKIGGILSTYDDLIENNLRRIVLLEESARLLYKEWFVSLHFPGHEHTRIVNGVPEGWRQAKVGDLISKIKRKKKINKEHYLEQGPIPCVDQSTNFVGGFTYDEDAKHTDPLPLIVFGDHTRILKFVDFPFASGADGTQLVYPDREDLSPEFFYFALKALDLSNYFYARHFKFLKEQEILIPEQKFVREFTKFARPNMSLISKLREENQRLKQARDLLLPNLMNGEIQV